MLIRIGETRWANLFGVRELNIVHVKTLGSEEIKFRVHIDCVDNSYDTDTVDTQAKAIALADGIAKQLNEEY